MTGQEIRKSFLSFFKEKSHEVVKASSLVPYGDSTLLFTNAGMVPFKGVFLGDETRDYKKAVSAQKCLRAGGKHNDLENVGRTARHHTFFEMLGNFSFGDYFKEKAISMAWEFLTETVDLPKNRLWITVFKDDNEAFDIWNKKMNIDTDKIIRCGEKDNFWSMGNTGPCGPCSEIHYDQGAEVGCKKDDCTVECDCDRYLEIWNLVFMQFNKDEAGNVTPLPKPSIDTGMGLERLAAVVQGKKSNFDTDLFSGIFRHIEETCEKNYGDDKNDDISMRVIADHIRAITFLISDGVLPSNEGRGYVLRRIIRRASRHGKLLSMDKPFLYLTAGAVTDEMGKIYPELIESREHCLKVIFHEEERFLDTLDQGLKLLEDEIQKIKQSSSNQLAGDVAFKLYDTFGFPLDLTEDILRGEDITVKIAGFDEAMQKQKESSRQAWSGSGESTVAGVFKQLSSELISQGINEITFTGYDTLESEGEILAIISNDNLIDSAKEGDEVDIIANKTPFYGESGGQKGDRGTILSRCKKNVVSVIDTVTPMGNLIVHKGVIKKGAFKTGDIVELKVDESRRLAIRKNHTATHLLQAALKNVLGEHIKQAGSLVSEKKLRFDFSHFAPLTAMELQRIEYDIFKQILKNSKISTETLPIEEAKKRGAVALFGEKYGDSVRVVSVPDFSMEFCGGTHVNMTGDIGPFKLLSEGGVAAGVRRIEAITGEAAYSRLVDEENELKEVARLVKGNVGEIARKVETVIEKHKKLENEMKKVKQKQASSSSEDLAEKTVVIKGIKFLATKVDGANANSLRSLMDNLKVKIKSGIIVLVAVEGNKVLLIAGVTNDLTDKFHAGKIIGRIAPVVGGKGGGRPDMAQAGGKDPSKINEALELAKGVVEEGSADDKKRRQVVERY